MLTFETESGAVYEVDDVRSTAALTKVGPGETRPLHGPREFTFRNAIQIGKSVVFLWKTEDDLCQRTSTTAVVIIVST